MANAIQKQNAISSDKSRHLVRSSYLDSARHLNDSFLNLGYDYRGKILKRMTSPELWANPLQQPLLAQIEALINYILEQVKYIKKTFSIAHSKDTTQIN